MIFRGNNPYINVTHQGTPKRSTAEFKFNPVILTFMVVNESLLIIDLTGLLTKIMVELSSIGDTFNAL